MAATRSKPNTTPKHIAIDARIIATSTGRYVERLLTNLQTIDKTNRYSVLVRPEQVSYWQPSADNFEVIEAPYKDFSFGEQIGVKRLLDSLKPDLTHFVQPQHPVLYKGKFVSTVHDLTLLDYSHPKGSRLVHGAKLAVFKHIVLPRLVKNAAHIITPTNYAKSRLLEMYDLPETRVTTTHLAADKLTAEPTEYRPMKKRQFLLAVGNAFPYKNLERLIDAFAMIAKSHPELHLVLVGKNSIFYEQLHQYVVEKGIQRVVFTGFVDDAQLAWLYGQAEAYVFPSLSEGFGLPGLEAMLEGCPVLASSNTCLPEVYGDSALYFDPFSVEDMATIITRVLGDRQERKKLIAAGKARVGDFSWKRMAEETLAVYQQALKN